jgi:hypothetical protein
MPPQLPSGGCFSRSEPQQTTVQTQRTNPTAVQDACVSKAHAGKVSKSNHTEAFARLAESTYTAAAGAPGPCQLLLLLPQAPAQPAQSPATFLTPLLLYMPAAVPRDVPGRLCCCPQAAPLQPCSTQALQSPAAAAAATPFSWLLVAGVVLPHPHTVSCQSLQKGGTSGWKRMCRCLAWSLSAPAPCRGLQTATTCSGTPVRQQDTNHKTQDNSKALLSLLMLGCCCLTVHRSAKALCLAVKLNARHPNVAHTQSV